MYVELHALAIPIYASTFPKDFPLLIFQQEELITARHSMAEAYKCG